MENPLKRIRTFSSTSTSSRKTPKPLLEKYIEPEKVAVVLVRNGGILLQEDTPLGRVSVRKKDSIFAHPAHKIPVEIRRTARTRMNKKGWRKYGGLFFGLLSSLCFSLTLILAKILRKNYSFHPINLGVWRFLGILIPSVPIALFYHNFTPENVLDTIYPLKKNLRHCFTYTMQGICACTSTLFLFYSLDFINIADTTIITRASPVFATFIAHLLILPKDETNKSCGWFSSLIVGILATIGICIVGRPSFIGGTTIDSKLWIGVILATGSMLCSSGLLILLRNIRETHFSLLLLFGGAIGVLQSFILALIVGVFKIPSSGVETLLLGTLATLTFLWQIFIIAALKYGSAGGVSVIRCLEIVFGFLWQFQFLEVYPDIYSGIAAGIIILAVVIISTRTTWIVGLSPDNTQRNGLLYLTTDTN